MIFSRLFCTTAKSVQGIKQSQKNRSDLCAVVFCDRNCFASLAVAFDLQSWADTEAISPCLPVKVSSLSLVLVTLSSLSLVLVTVTSSSLVLWSTLQYTTV
jgi:hypothetical protein